MQRTTVLITGVTGHVGFRVLEIALQRGFVVRAVVRSSAKADAVRRHLDIGSNHKKECLSLVIVPDFTAPHAFDKVIQDIQYIIHCASPIPMGAPTSDEPEHDFVKPAVEGTLNLIESASLTPSIKRIVVTSSCIATVPLEAALESTGTTYTADMRQSTVLEPLEPGIPSFVAYAAGKVAALNSTEKWMEERRPHFDIIHLMPSYVLGRVGMATSVSDLRRTANKFILNMALGLEEGSSDPSKMAMIVNHIDDCARIHVEALDAKIRGNQNFMISHGSDLHLQWDQAINVIKHNFPQAFETGLLPCSGRIETVDCCLDSTKTQQTFGLYHTYEDAVREVVQQLLDFSG
jgi:nucleoside-diphosphate-sugar epimerase